MGLVLRESQRLWKATDVYFQFRCNICRQHRYAVGETSRQAQHNSVGMVGSLRTYSNQARKLAKEDEIKETVFQYVGRNAKRADRVYAWGYAATGALGVRKFMRPEKKGEYARRQQHSPYRLEFWDKYNLKVHDVACGYGFTVYLCQDDKRHLVFGTGINTDSQVGYQEYPRKSGRLLDYVIEPAPIQLPLLQPDTTRMVKVSCGRAHTVICTDTEGVFSFGHNSYGQCGRAVVEGETFRGSEVINKIPFNEPILQVECGQDHTLFLTEAGQVYSCGLGTDGQTGLGHTDLTSEMSLVGGDLTGEKIIQVSSKVDCVLAVSENGDVFGWGNNEYDQLAFVAKETNQLNTPLHLSYKGIGKVVKVAAAGSTCAILNDQGEVFAWGYGILGKGPEVEEGHEPMHLPSTLFGRNELNPDSRVVDITCGINHFGAVTNSGELYMWGRNDTACLGLGHLNNQYFPFKVQVPGEIKNLACGVDHTIALCKGFA